MKVFVLGYSHNPSRYSHLAYNLLKEKGHDAIQINPSLPRPCFATLDAAARQEGSPHTITIYVRKDISSMLTQEIIRMNPIRVIFNPGTENEKLKLTLLARDIEVVEGCTLVMLNTRQF